MSKTVVGILTGILIFIAAGILAVYWIGIMRVEREQKKPRLARTQALRVESRMAGLGYPRETRDS